MESKLRLDRHGHEYSVGMAAGQNPLEAQEPHKGRIVAVAALVGVATLGAAAEIVGVGADAIQDINKLVDNLMFINTDIQWLF